MPECTFAQPHFTNAQIRACDATFFCLLLGCTSDPGDIPHEGSAPPQTEIPFTQHFAAVDTIQLEADPLIGEIRAMDVNEAGDFLISDWRAQEMYLFSPDGTHRRTLDPEPCHPGFNWSPIRAQFAPDGSIVVANNGPGGYQFEPNGQCRAPMHDTYSASFFFTFDQDGAMYGLYNYPDEYFIRKMTSEGEEIDTFGHDGDFAAVAQRWRVGGLVSDHNENVYLALPHSPHLHVYSTSGTLVRTVGHQPSYFEPMSEDIADHTGSPQAIMDAVEDLLATSSSTSKVFRLDENAFLIEYNNSYMDSSDRTRGLTVIDTMGTPLVEGEIRFGSDIRLRAAHNGLLYALAESGTQSGTLNPKIVTYRFIPSDQDL